MIRKSSKHLYTEHWTAISTLLGLISSAHHDLHQWRSTQQPQYAEAETLSLGHQFTLHVSDAELTSYGELRDHFDFMCLGDPVVEFRLLHTVAVGSISSGGDHGVHCW